MLRVFPTDHPGMGPFPDGFALALPTQGPPSTYLIMQQGLIDEGPQVGEAARVAQAGTLGQLLPVPPQLAGGQRAQLALCHLGLQQLGGPRQVLLRPLWVLIEVGQCPEESQRLGGGGCGHRRTPSGLYMSLTVWPSLLSPGARCTPLPASPQSMQCAPGSAGLRKSLHYIPSRFHQLAAASSTQPPARSPGGP